jgi:hypothetical protein
MSITSIKGIYDPIAFTQTASCGLRTLEDHLELFGVDMDPDYQRDHVWTQEQQENFMGHLLEGGTIPDIILNERLYSDQGGMVEYVECVDGKQRITAVLRWLKGEIGARLTGGDQVWYDKLDTDSRTILATSIRLPFKHVRLDRAGVLRLYLRLNRGGTVHSEEEIEKVRQLLAEEEAKAND